MSKELGRPFGDSQTFGLLFCAIRSIRKVLQSVGSFLSAVLRIP